ncbi:RNA exonuclease-like protein Rex3 [Amylocarpus encephaloides]|uniref:RNA exonuclease-like protein Rex3 n=1 Tax=Amylocarpus encephaloides TaxID=45428 RepID=A0A9P8C6N4_9HELO|nr:RNA exonuclease-like protein Rex3 [Amylocarpus encephaloides]
MFTSKGLFSNLECPHQHTCVLPRCIFGHSKSSVGEVVAANKTGSQVGNDLYQDQGGSRKRQRLGMEKSKTPASSSSSNTSAFTGFRATNESSPNNEQKNAKPQFSSIDRFVSPPPFRRKGPDGNIVPVKKTAGRDHVSSNGRSSTSTPSKSISRAKTPVKTPIKVESLNPRNLKSNAPARHNIRLRLLQMLHEQLKRLNSELLEDANDAEEKLVLSDQALITMALDIEEESAGQRSIYSNIVKNKIFTYKRMTVKEWKEEREKVVAKSEALESKPILTTPVQKPEGPPTPVETDLTTSEEIAFLPYLCADLDVLSRNGYVTTVPTDEEIEKARKGIESSKGWELCDRCQSRFQVFPGRRREDGALASGGSCTYHYGRFYWADRDVMDPTSKREKKYRCCGQVVGESPGCTKADCHVFKISEVKRLAAVLNFEWTPENPSKDTSSPVCIDGEMGYTVHGLELIRLTATSWPSGDTLFDVLVKPIGEILDLNSRYSGVQPKDMIDAPPWSSIPPSKQKLQLISSPAAARSLLFSHLSPNTPVIGHGLENDLNAVRFIHPKIIDTALLFPHKSGLPYRNSLKYLMHRFLNREIQVVVVGKEGHDSQEDANAAGMLVRWKVGSKWREMKGKGWVLENGRFFEEVEGRGLKDPDDEGDSDV